ncbi:MAG TPA: hypothetical protein VK780_10520, partial [Thermoanaerobaculia bacterium]|nr:hypothetical protein [Thermoanaerobaculia bacterium]
MTLIEVEREAAGPSPPTAAERPVEAKRFNAWTNLVITPAVELVVIALPLVAVLFLRRFRGLGFGSSVLVFYLCMVGWTFLVMRLIRAFFPIRPAVLTPSRTPRAFYVWTLWSFLATTNLHMLYVRSILSVNFRKTFYRLLGAHLG